MTDTVNQASIFLPVLLIAALTMIAFFKLAAARMRVAKEHAVDSDFYRAHLGKGEPDYAVVASRHYANLFELPVLFYVACLTAFLVNGVTTAVLIMAWGYAILRVVQSLIHLTYNNPAHRGGAFALSWLFLIALWGTLAWKICALV